MTIWSPACITHVLIILFHGLCSIINFLSRASSLMIYRLITLVRLGDWIAHWLKSLIDWVVQPMIILVSSTFIVRLEKKRFRFLRLTRLFDLLVGVSRKIKSAFFFQSHDELDWIVLTVLRKCVSRSRNTQNFIAPSMTYPKTVGPNPFHKALGPPSSLSRQIWTVALTYTFPSHF